MIIMIIVIIIIIIIIIIITVIAYCKNDIIIKFNSILIYLHANLTAQWPIIIIQFNFLLFVC
jgi:hypothetical protein